VTTNQLPVKDKRPKKPFTSIAVLGWRAFDLVNVHKTEIENRLPGVTVRLGNDLESIKVVVPGAIQARNMCVASTHAQQALAEKGCDRARDIRATVRRGGAAVEVRKAYGVGRPLNPNNPGSVIAALQQIIERATKEPDEAAGFGLIADDVTALSSLMDALLKADTEQDQKRASAPLSTKERNRTGNRIIQTIVLIAGAGQSAFVDDPEIRARFSELMDGLKTQGKKAKKSTAQAGTAPSAAPTGSAPGTAPTGGAPVTAPAIGAPIAGSPSAGSPGGTPVNPPNTASGTASGSSPA
jgi:hypothetical protein